MKLPYGVKSAALLPAGLIALGAGFTGAVRLRMQLPHVSLDVIDLSGAVLFVAVFCWTAIRLSYVPIAKPLNDIKTLEDLGLLESTAFHAKRAMQVLEFEDEGSHYFLELHDGRILYLNGQYLYDYDGKNGTAVQFPCTQFSVRRHRDKGYPVDMICGGSVLSLSCTVAPFPDEYYQRDDIYQDADIIADRSFDEVRRELERNG